MRCGGSLGNDDCPPPGDLVGKLAIVTNRDRDVWQVEENGLVLRFDPSSGFQLTLELLDGQGEDNFGTSYTYVFPPERERERSHGGLLPG